MTIEAVIFDMDGLLIDSEPFWQAAEIRAFAEIGLVLDADMCSQTIGIRVDEVVKYWHERMPWDSGKYPLKEVEANIVDGVIDLILADGKPMPGVDSVFQLVLSRPVKIGLASSSPLRIIQAVIKHLDLAKHFEVVHSAESEAFGKPHPAAFITAAEKLEVAPQRCLVFEDSFNGLLAAKSARMTCVAVPDHYFKDDPRFVIADMVLNSLEEFDSGSWEKLSGNTP